MVVGILVYTAYVSIVPINPKADTSPAGVSSSNNGEEEIEEVVRNPMSHKEKRTSKVEMVDIS